MKDCTNASGTNGDVQLWSIVCERLAVTRLLLRTQQEELNTPVKLRHEPSLFVSRNPVKISSTNDSRQAKGTDQRQNQEMKLPKAPSTKATDIRDWWKENDYPRDLRKGTGKTKRLAAPKTLAAQPERHRPAVQNPVTPERQIWHCAVNEEAAMVLGCPVRYEEGFGHDRKVFARPLSSVFDAGPGSTPETARNLARRAAFNARLTHDLVDWVEERAKGRVNKEGSPTPTRRVSAPAKWRSFYRARQAKLLRSKLVSVGPSQVSLRKLQIISVTVCKQPYRDGEGPVLWPNFLFPFCIHYLNQETDNCGVGQIKCLSAEPIRASVQQSQSYVNTERAGDGASR